MQTLHVRQGRVQRKVSSGMHAASLMADGQDPPKSGWVTARCSAIGNDARCRESDAGAAIRRFAMGVVVIPGCGVRGQYVVEGVVAAIQDNAHQCTVAAAASAL